MGKVLPFVVAGGLIVASSGAAAAEQQNAVVGAPCQAGALTAVTSSRDHSGPAPSAAGATNFRQEMLKRLSDPQQRAEMRDQFRRSLPESKAELKELLGLDPETESKFYDVLADQQMEKQVEMFSAGDCADAARAESLFQERADAETRRTQALRAVLGQDKLDRYLDYQSLASEYLNTRSVDFRLAPADKLTPSQRTQLALLMHEHERRLQEGRRQHLPQPALGREYTTAMLARQARSLDYIAVADAELERRAAEILNRPQLASLTAARARFAQIAREHFESSMAQAQITLAEVNAVPRPALVSGNIKYGIAVTVNGRAPMKATYDGLCGEPHTFSLGDDLLVEATPLLYDDGYLDVELAFYERAPAKRRLGELTSSTPPAAQSGGGQVAGSARTVLSGNKGYAINVELKPS